MLEVQPTTLSLTDAAASKLRELTAEETNPDIGLRVYVYSGGCSGFRYGMMIEDSPTAGRQPPRGQRRPGLRRRQEHRPPQGHRDRLRRHAHGRRLHGQQSERRRGLWLRLELPDGRRRGYRTVLLALTHPPASDAASTLEYPQPPVPPTGGFFCPERMARGFRATAARLPGRWICRSSRSTRSSAPASPCRSTSSSRATAASWKSVSPTTRRSVSSSSARAARSDRSRRRWPGSARPPRSANRARSRTAATRSSSSARSGSPSRT